MGAAIQRMACGLVLALAGVARAAMPHLDLAVTLDPATRSFEAKAQLSSTTGQRPVLSLNPLLKVSRSTWDERTRRLSVDYAGVLPALPPREQRNTPVQAELFASPEGSYLAPSAQWYPDPGEPFTYRVRLSLPAGQKGLVPGRQVSATDSGRFTADYRFDHPAEGLWLMAGPYQVAQQSYVADDGQAVTVRTWFHPELTGLADGYLQDSARYLQRYSRSIGAYPFGDFSIVSSPLPHGLGMPSLTYLGREVLRLPFIRATSLGHEVLHNWWGNGVYPDWSAGNWSEGLTTFMADYAYREDQSADAAQAMRLTWLRDLAAVRPADETALAAFTSRRHGISSVIGYGKSAMLFLMLRDEIGSTAFDRGIRLFWQRQRFRVAGWTDLEAAFAEAAGRDLSGFFAQWLRRAASPQLALAPPAAGDGAGRFRLQQRGDPFDLQVPLRVRLAAGETRDIAVRVRERETVIDLAALGVAGRPVQVELDPDWRLWRRLEPGALPPIFRDVFISPRAELLVATSAPQWRAPANALAQRLLESDARPVTEAGLLAAPDVPALVIGDADSLRALLPRLGLGDVPPALARQGSARAWTARAANGKTLALVSADDPQALANMQRALPHYGRQSWLVFEADRVVQQGAWPAGTQALSLDERRR
jgi:aminopeptidase N